MNEIPEEHELMSFFEVEPIKLDKEPEFPFNYNILTYVVINDSERIEINISPAYGDIEIFWEQNSILKFNWKLYDINSLKIEKNNGHECLIVKFNADNISDCCFWVKPYFKLIGGMKIIH